MRHMKRGDWIMLASLAIINAYPLYALCRYAASAGNWWIIMWLLGGVVAVAAVIALLMMRSYAKGEADAMQFDRIVFAAKDKEIARLRRMLEDAPRGEKI